MNLIPPATGNPELDTFLYQLSQLVAGTEQASVTPVPGGYSPSGNLIEYPFRYVHVKFADDNIGTGMSDSPTGKLYYGLFNSPSSTESTTPADYTWVLVSGGGMGTTKNFWYRTIGGTYLDYAIASASPGNLFTIDTGTAIDLNVNVSAEDLIGRVAFAKAATQQLASAPYNVATGGSVSFPTTGTWGFSEVWQATPPVVSGDEILFQLDGVYNASTNTTVWGAPYLAAFKVGQLSAIQANMGTLTAGTVILGSSPAISGTTMTGSGTRLYDDGRIVAGDASTNLVWDGSGLYLNGGELTVGSSPAISGTTMTGSGAKVYADGRFSLGKAAQNVTYDGSNLYLNGFLVNQDATEASAVFLGTGIASTVFSYDTYSSDIYIEMPLTTNSFLAEISAYLSASLTTGGTPHNLATITTIVVRRFISGSWTVINASLNAFLRMVSATIVPISGSSLNPARSAAVITIPSGDFVAGDTYRISASIGMTLSAASGGIATDSLDDVSYTGSLKAQEIKL
jgi:hypothetical protein